ncbi:MAG: elongation factor P [bacterium]|nr:elongation factor P [bacterium]
MIINATQIREGMILNIDNELYRVTWKMHRTPGKGTACMQTKLKNIISGKNLEQRFLSNERVEKADLETRSMQYLYQESSDLVFMDNETYEQIHISCELTGEGLVKYLEEGTSYDITLYEDQPVGVDTPKTINIKVTYAPPEIKKATATNTMRAVTLENDLEVLAPGFIKDGDIIKINTETNEYIERVKE